MTNDFRKLAHLREQLGEKRWRALIDSDNTRDVKRLCDRLVENTLPKKMTVGGRTYEILKVTRGDEYHTNTRTLIERAKEMDANLGRDDLNHLLEHQDEIPNALRGKVIFFFTKLIGPHGYYNAEHICSASWNGGCLVEGWTGADGDYESDHSRVLRRKA